MMLKNLLKNTRFAGQVDISVWDSDDEIDFIPLYDDDKVDYREPSIKQYLDCPVQMVFGGIDGHIRVEVWGGNGND